MSLGEKLYELRKKQGLTQEQAADKLGVTRQTISKWETDQSTPDFNKLVPISKLYGISLDELAGNEQKETIRQETVYVPTHYHYEYKSKRILFGLPLIHIHFGRGLYQMCIRDSTCTAVIRILPLLRWSLPKDILWMERTPGILITGEPLASR